MYPHCDNMSPEVPQGEFGMPKAIKDVGRMVSASIRYNGQIISDSMIDSAEEISNSIKYHAINSYKSISSISDELNKNNNRNEISRLLDKIDKIEEVLFEKNLLDKMYENLSINEIPKIEMEDNDILYCIRYNEDCLDWLLYLIQNDKKSIKNVLCDLAIKYGLEECEYNQGQFSIVHDYHIASTPFKIKAEWLFSRIDKNPFIRNSKRQYKTFYGDYTFKTNVYKITEEIFNKLWKAYRPENPEPQELPILCDFKSNIDKINNDIYISNLQILYMEMRKVYKSLMYQ